MSPGLAISGGVDSMALASLCSKLWRDHEFPAKCQAFVVDHGLRSNSAEEAEQVAMQLQRMCRSWPYINNWHILTS